MQSTIQATLKLSEQAGSLPLAEPTTGGVLEVLKRQITRMSQLVRDLLLQPHNSIPPGVKEPRLTS